MNKLINILFVSPCMCAHLNHAGREYHNAATRYTNANNMTVMISIMDRFIKRASWGINA